jgi:hypothetical protein
MYKREHRLNYNPYIGDAQLPGIWFPGDEASTASRQYLWLVESTTLAPRISKTDRTHFGKKYKSLRYTCVYYPPLRQISNARSHAVMQFHQNETKIET